MSMSPYLWSMTGFLSQCIFKNANYTDTTFTIKKLGSSERYIRVHFYSSSIDKRTGILKHRCVCGIWHLNKESKMDKVWAVVTPYYLE